MKNNQGNQATGGRGGARPGAGRKPGKVGAAKRAIAEQAKEYGEAALRTLVDIATNGQNESARVSAANAILDRGYGKAPQNLDVSNSDGSLAAMILAAVDGKTRTK